MDALTILTVNMYFHINNGLWLMRNWKIFVIYHGD
jgi:hypothetical protein